MTYTDYLEYVRSNLLYRAMPSQFELRQIEKEFEQMFPGNYELTIKIPNEHTIEIFLAFEDILEQVEWKLRYG